MRVQRRRPRAGVGDAPRPRWPTSRALFTACAAGADQRAAGQRTQSQRRPVGRRPITAQVLSFVEECVAAGAGDCEAKRRPVDAGRIHRTGQSGRADGAPDRRGRLRPDAVGAPGRRRSSRTPTPRRRWPQPPPNWPRPATWSACAWSATTTCARCSTATNGVLAGMAPGGIIAIHSTVHPDTCREIAELAAAKGVSVIDAPVSGGGPAVEAGHAAGDGRRRRGRRREVPPGVRDLRRPDRAPRRRSARSGRQDPEQPAVHRQPRAAR